MNSSVTLETTSEPANEAAELQAGIVQCLREVEQLREQMSRDQIEIERSQKRTRLLLAEIKAILTPLVPRDPSY